MKTAKDYLEEAHAVVPKVTFEDAMTKHKAGATVFIDVRDTADIEKSGTIEGARRIPRGMIEFRADPNTPLYDDTFRKDGDYILVCGAGGQAALAGKTLHDMGYENVANGGGFPDWKEKGGPTEGT